MVALGIAGYILVNQRCASRSIEDKPFTVWVELQNARGVTPGQGQTVRVAGMRVGDVGKVELEDGRARVRMDLDPEYDDLVRRDATVLLRPRTGLKDMFLALDPGSRSEPALKEGEVLELRQHAARRERRRDPRRCSTPTRAPTSSCCINGAGKGLKDRRHDLREVFAPPRPAAPRPRRAQHRGGQAQAQPRRA